MHNLLTQISVHKQCECWYELISFFFQKSESHKMTHNLLILLGGHTNTFLVTRDVFLYLEWLLCVHEESAAQNSVSRRGTRTRFPYPILLSSPLGPDLPSRPGAHSINLLQAPAMCSCTCARLPHPLFRPAPSPKRRPAPPQGPTPARSRALVARAGAGAGAGAPDDAHSPPSSFDFLALKRELELEEEGAVVDVEADEGGGAVSQGDGERDAERRSASGTRRRGRRRQMARRSALLAKQVISVSSARSLGFVSQLWVDGASVRTGCCSLHLFLFGFGRAACCEPRDSGQFMAAIIT